MEPSIVFGVMAVMTLMAILGLSKECKRCPVKENVTKINVKTLSPEVK